MESGQGGLGCPSALLVEPPRWRKSHGQLGKLLWSDHSPLLLLDCWKKNASFIKHSHRLHGARGCRVGSRRGPAGASRRNRSLTLKSNSTEADGKMHLPMFRVHFGVTYFAITNSSSSMAACLCAFKVCNCVEVNWRDTQGWGLSPFKCRVAGHCF